MDSTFIPKKYKTEKSSRRHNEVFLIEKVFSHSCSYCGKKFKLAGNLETHLKIHKGQKSFKCEICHKSFTTKGNLKCHIKLLHHNIREFICNFPECSKKFINRCRLNIHMRTHVVFSNIVWYKAL